MVYTSELKFENGSNNSSHQEMAHKKWFIIWFTLVNYGSQKSSHQETKKFKMVHKPVHIRKLKIQNGSQNSLHQEITH